jgi:predicted phage terminase large subunit-like protein
MLYPNAYNVYKILNKIVKTNFKIFLQKAFYSLHPKTDFIHNWHIDLITEYLKALEKRQIKRLIINMPPRYLKSFCVTVSWPAWLLANNPARKIIVASHSMALAKKFSQDTKAIMSENWYQQAFQTRLSPKQSTKEKFCTTKHGFRIATSINSNITGEGGDYLIVDDPLTPAHAISSKKREAVNDWFNNTFFTRLNDKKNGVIVVVMQRLHTMDLSGFLLPKNNWHVLKIPAIAETTQNICFNNFHYSRKEKEVLCKPIEGIEEIESIKKALGAHVFSAQYQQNPLNIETSVIQRKWIKRYNKKQDFIAIYQSWDTAVKIGLQNDYSVCTTWGVTDNAYYLLDVFRKKLSYPYLKEMLMRQYKKYKPAGVIVEDKSSGQQLIQDISKLHVIPLIKFLPQKSKLIRFLLITNILEAGKVYLPYKASWVADFELELFAFPDVTHDDQIDSMSQFLIWNQNKKQQANFRIRRL